MPNYGGSKTGGMRSGLNEDNYQAIGEADNQASWGFTFEEIADMLAETVKNHSKSGKVTVVCHDWGAIYGYSL